jgi:hypothetical protein
MNPMDLVLRLAWLVVFMAWTTVQMSRLHRLRQRWGSDG